MGDQFFDLLTSGASHRPPPAATSVSTVRPDLCRLLAILWQASRRPAPASTGTLAVRTRSRQAFRRPSASTGTFATRPRIRQVSGRSTRHDRGSRRPPPASTGAFVVSPPPRPASCRPSSASGGFSPSAAGPNLGFYRPSRPLQASRRSFSFSTSPLAVPPWRGPGRLPSLPGFDYC